MDLFQIAARVSISKSGDYEDQLQMLQSLANSDRYYINFGDVDRIAPNLSGHYGTPFGIYAYPLNGHIMDKLQSGDSLFSIEKEHLNILQSKGHVLDLNHYSTSDLDTDIKKLINLGFDVNNTSDKEPGRVILDITKELTNGGKKELAWSMLLKKLGYSGLVDQGSGILYDEPSQLSQAVFFDTSGYDIVGSYKNTLWYYRGMTVENAVNRVEEMFKNGDIDNMKDFFNSLKKPMRNGIKAVLDPEITELL